MTTEVRAAREAAHLGSNETALIDALAAQEGGALTYARLEALGIFRPASVGYELAAAGWRITPKLIDDVDGCRRLGLRLLASPEPAVAVSAPRRWPRRR